jgi:hypothetical protein
MTLVGGIDEEQLVSSASSRTAPVEFWAYYKHGASSGVFNAFSVFPGFVAEDDYSLFTRAGVNFLGECLHPFSKSFHVHLLRS